MTWACTWISLLGLFFLLMLLNKSILTKGKLMCIKYLLFILWIIAYLMKICCKVHGKTCFEFLDCVYYKRLFPNVMEIYKTVLSKLQFLLHMLRILKMHISSFSRFWKVPRSRQSSLNLTQTNNKRNNAIKAHMFHIHHILNELYVFWTSMTRLSKPLNEFCLSHAL